MKRVKVLILQAPGTNCDRETGFCFRYLGAEAEFLLIKKLLKRPQELHFYHILCLPGGFTYGDDISAGRVLANQLRFLLWKELNKFYRDGKLILGICNGFQVLVKSGILPFWSGQNATLTLNDCGHFIDEWVHLKVNKDNSSLWLKNLPEVFYLPIAHAEGKFLIPKSNFPRIRGLVALQYCSPEGKADFSHNPNGSLFNIAGITEPEGRILGLMPHPERHSFLYQNPYWTSLDGGPEREGLLILKNGVDYARSVLLS